MVRFLHTSDWQMGMKAVHMGLKAKQVRDKRFDSASAIADLAKEQQVDFVVIAGDIFEHHDVDEVVVKRTVDILNRFESIPVNVLPGNHDPYFPGGVWERQSWQRVGPHVVLCSEPEEIRLGDSVAIYPCPLKQKRSNLDPTSWIPARSEGDTRIRIGIAHGALDILPDTVNFPISKQRTELSGLDYLALGDWHSQLQHDRAVYPGTMEATSFGEREPGHVVLVDISAAGEAPRLDWRRTGILSWAQFNPMIRDITDVESFDVSIRRLGPLEALLLRIEPNLQLEATAETLDRLVGIKEEVQDRAFWAEWIDEPTPGTNLELTSLLPNGILQGVNEALSAILEGRMELISEVVEIR